MRNRRRIVDCASVGLRIIRFLEATCLSLQFWGLLSRNESAKNPLLHFARSLNSSIAESECGMNRRIFSHEQLWKTCFFSFKIYCHYVCGIGDCYQPNHQTAANRSQSTDIHPQTILIACFNGIQMKGNDESLAVRPHGNWSCILVPTYVVVKNSLEPQWLDAEWFASLQV